MEDATAPARGSRMLLCSLLLPLVFLEDASVMPLSCWFCFFDLLSTFRFLSCSPSFPSLLLDSLFFAPLLSNRQPSRRRCSDLIRSYPRLYHIV